MCTYNILRSTINFNIIFNPHPKLSERKYYKVPSKTCDMNSKLGTILLKNRRNRYTN